jgi:group I intron endonuclease
MDKTFQAYLVTNIVTGVRYVGQTKNTLWERLGWHFRKARDGSPSPFHKALREYGEESFTVELLIPIQEGAELTDEQSLDDWEKKMIRLFGISGPLYNVAQNIKGNRNRHGSRLGHRNTHCKRGHLLTDDNLYIYHRHDGICRLCKACCKVKRMSNPEKHRESNQRWRENNREKHREATRRWRKNHPEYQRDYRRKKRQQMSRTSSSAATSLRFS